MAESERRANRAAVCERRYRCGCVFAADEPLAQALVVWCRSVRIDDGTRVAHRADGIHSLVSICSHDLGLARRGRHSFSDQYLQHGPTYRAQRVAWARHHLHKSIDLANRRAGCAAWRPGNCADWQRRPGLRLCWFDGLSRCARLLVYPTWSRRALRARGESVESVIDWSCPILVETGKHE